MYPGFIQGINILDHKDINYHLKTTTEIAQDQGFMSIILIIENQIQMSPWGVLLNKYSQINGSNSVGDNLSKQIILYN